MSSQLEDESETLNLQSQTITELYPFQNVSMDTPGKRLLTFSNWPFGSQFWPVQLSNAGFVYLQEDTKVRCFSCGVITSVEDWKKGEKPEVVHLLINYDCEYIRRIFPCLKDEIKKFCEKQTHNSGSLSEINAIGEIDIVKNTNQTEECLNTLEFDDTVESSIHGAGTKPKSSSTRKASDNAMHFRTPSPEMNIRLQAYDSIINYSHTTYTSAQNCGRPNEICETQHQRNLTKPHHTAEQGFQHRQVSKEKDDFIYEADFTYPHYRNLQERLLSYRAWPLSAKQSPQLLAESGCFYTGVNDIVRCFCCDLGLSEWSTDDFPWNEHARHSPRCWFLRNQKGQEFIDSVQREWRKLYMPKYAAFNDMKSRLATFDGWRDDIEQTPQILADAGFFYTGETDVVRCHYCDGGLRNWEQGDIPWEEHARWFPTCKYLIKMMGCRYIEQIKEKYEKRRCTYGTEPFINEIQFNVGSRGTRSTPILTSVPQAMTNPLQTATPSPTSETSSTSATSTNITEVASNTSTSSSPWPPQATTINTSSNTANSSSTTVGSESSRSRIDPLGINFEKPRYPAYAVLTVRIDTYNGWPSYLDQTPQIMSLAGFFYSGYGDHARCFFCGAGLRNWEVGDDPWVEHARWFPKCEFLRQNRGDSFVNMVQKIHHEVEKEHQIYRNRLEAFDKECQQSVLNQDLVKILRKLNVEENHIKKAVDMYIKQCDNIDFNLIDLLEFIPNSSHLKKAAKSLPYADTENMDHRDQLRQINEQRKDILRCACCKHNQVSMVFLDCGHNITCSECGDFFDVCPKCNTKITERMKTYLC